MTKFERQQRLYQGFEHLYTAEDIRFLAALDDRHNTLSGPATKKLGERAYFFQTNTIPTISGHIGCAFVQPDKIKVLSATMLQL